LKDIIFHLQTNFLFHIDSLKNFKVTHFTNSHNQPIFPTIMWPYTIVSGDTLNLLASEFNTTVAAIEADNPTANPNDLEIGQVISMPGLQYTIAAGDTYNVLATQFNSTVTAIQLANPGIDPNNLQIGQVINIPGGTSTLPTYTIVAGDTLNAIASSFNTTVAAILAVNPGINANDLQIGQIINLPAGSPPGPPPPPGGNGYVNYYGPASNYPPMDQWASYDSLWSFNKSLMAGNDNSNEINLIGQAIQAVSSQYLIDPRVILCIIMQESGGNVNVADTIAPGGYPVNRGIMQSFNGVRFDANNPAGSITQMVTDGTNGTKETMGALGGDGLVQDYGKWGNYYEACRAYNSGNVDITNLNDGLGATANYVQSVANRLMGHVWSGM
jgi:LysM repeat protein